MSDISKIELPDKTVYDIKDAVAREITSKIGTAAYQDSENFASSNHTHSDYLKTSGGTTTGWLFTKGGTNVHTAGGTLGETGYVHIATFNIIAGFCNSPIVISFVRRGDKTATSLYIGFLSVNTNDPRVESFLYTGSSNEAYLSKAETSKWYLYIKKSEAYDSIDIVEYHMPKYNDGKISVEWTNELIETLPQDCIQATIGGANASPISAGLMSVTDKNKLDNIFIEKGSFTLVPSDEGWKNVTGECKGYYTKIDNLVFVRAQYSYSFPSAVVKDIYLSGFPFSSNDSSYASSSLFYTSEKYSDGSVKTAVDNISFIGNKLYLKCNDNLSDTLTGSFTGYYFTD